MAHALEWDIGVAMGSSIDADGFQDTQYDAEGEDQSGAAPYETHHFFGSWGRPLDPVVDAGGQPDPSRGCPMLYALEGGKGHAWALEDPRIVPILPTPAPGEHITYSSAGCFTRHHVDGSISHATTDKGGQGGFTVASRVLPTGFQRFGSFGRETFDAGGWRVKHASGAQVALGAIGGLPAPLSSLGSFFRVTAGIIEINASAVTIGPTGAAGQPVAQAAPLVTVLATVAASLTAITAAIQSDPQIAAPAKAAVAAAVTASVASISACLPLISTQTAIG